MTNFYKKSLGITGEQIVEQWLSQNNFHILARNYSSRYGEIDLIAQKNNIITFIEVKTRKKEYFPTSLVINKTKQQKIIKTAQFFILENNFIEKILRFDIAIVVLNNQNTEIRYISNAFTKMEF